MMNVVQTSPQSCLTSLKAQDSKMASRALTKGTEAAGNNGDEERQPGRPDELPNRPQVESTEPADVQVEPGGETDAEQKGSIMLESTDTGINGEVI